MQTIRTVTPVNGSTYVERAVAGEREVDAAIAAAVAAQREWRTQTIEERAAALSAFVDAFVAERDDIATELTWQMGRPIRYTPGEVRGFEERARTMIALAPQALADLDAGPKEGFGRLIRREPLGVALVIAPWNYPYLTAVNAVVPALMAGNAVLLKHSHQTPLCAERFAQAARQGGLPAGLLQALHLSHEATARMIKDPRIGHLAFTGSVAGGAAVEEAAAGRFLSLGLELGGKDPAYVRADADLAHAVENLVDGAFFNSGQSCCGIERIYVHADVYDRFVEGAAELTRRYVLDDPTKADTTLGPMVRTSRVRARADRRSRAPGRATARRRKSLSAQRARHAVCRAADPRRRRSLDARHDRGDLRSRGRHHEGTLRRRGDRPHERQRLRPDGCPLDIGPGGRDGDR